MPLINPTRVRLRRCSIMGVDVRLLTQKISVYETVCKPYISGEVTILDNNNVINNLRLRGGEPISFAFDGGGGRTYSCDHFITSISDSKQSQNKRAVIYTIQTVGPSFMYDRANLVQRSDVNIPGSAVIQSIFGQFLSGDAPLNIFPSLGLIAKTEIGGFVTANKKPFTAIGDIAKRLTYGGYKTGSTVFFRNRDEYVVAPLEHLFATASPQEFYEQRSTWGSEWHHVFTSTNAIIQAATINKGENDSGIGGATNLAMAAGGALNLFDIAKGEEAIPAMFGQIAKAIGSGADIGGVSRFVRGKLGGIQNVLQMDGRRNDPSQDQSLNAVQENMFKAQVKDAPQYLIKVPIQTGLNATVGRGVRAKLLPPNGDGSKGAQRLPENFLVADLCHECFFDKREVQATTTLRIVALGYAG